MSLATFHTNARRAAAILRETPPRIAARLCGVDVNLALSMQEWLSLAADDAGEVPTAFRDGAACACFALVKISVIKPAVFWGAVVAIPCLPILIALRWV